MLEPLPDLTAENAGRVTREALSRALAVRGWEREGWKQSELFETWRCSTPPWGCAIVYVPVNDYSCASLLLRSERVLSCIYRMVEHDVPTQEAARRVLLAELLADEGDKE